MRVGLFVTCLADLMRPEIGFPALQPLEAAGCEASGKPFRALCRQRK